MKHQLPDIKAFSARIRTGDRVALGRAITYVESSLPSHQAFIQDVLNELMPYTGNSIRIGITGSPGVGKSTFVEALGTYLINQGHKVGVLAVDPTSRQTGGSILGDKTRMTKLSASSSAFVRPSPAGKTLGGVARHTRETILICEAAGYDVILVETVGVGQSETAVYEMTDFYLLMILSGAGDELQGIKRGVVELADLVVVNKADGERKLLAQKAKAAYSNALHLFPAKESTWTPLVLTASALKNIGIEDIWKQVQKHHTLVKETGYFQIQRQHQLLQWMEDSLHLEILNHFFADEILGKAIKNSKKQVLELKITPFSAAKQLVLLFLQK